MTKRAGRSRRPEQAASRPSVEKTTGRFAVRPGTFNLAGELFTPAGDRLALTARDVSATDAAAFVRAGALVAFEACGCGGGGDCRPVWPDSAQVRAAAAGGSDLQERRNPVAPTWIDLWGGDNATVVFCHGGLTWGALFD